MRRVSESRGRADSRKASPRGGPDGAREPQPIVLRRGAGLSLTMDGTILNALRGFVPALVEEMVEAGQRDEWLSASRK
eukprot:5245599-Prymnesium_polylepis.1